MTAESTLAEPVPQRQERLTVHERLFELVDPDSLVELGSQARHSVTAFDMARRRPAGDGVVTGLARVEDRPVALFAQDSAVLGGSLGETHAGKIRRVLEWAGRSRMPVVGLLDSGGARRDLAAAPDSRDELVERYRVEATGATLAAERMSVDEIVTPEETRTVVAATLCALEGANRPHYRHDNLPQ